MGAHGSAIGISIPYCPYGSALGTDCEQLYAMLPVGSMPSSLFRISGTPSKHNVTLLMDQGIQEICRGW
eukprot:3928206-Karenia_brevis.AAC.1